MQTLLCCRYNSKKCKKCSQIYETYKLKPHRLLIQSFEAAVSSLESSWASLYIYIYIFEYLDIYMKCKLKTFSRREEQTPEVCDVYAQTHTHL